MEIAVLALGCFWGPEIKFSKIDGIIKIPKNPIKTANHLKIPTFSLNKNIEKIVVKIGAAKVMLTTVAKGNSLKAIKIAIKAINPDVHLNKCKPGLLV